MKKAGFLYIFFSLIFLCLCLFIKESVYAQYVQTGNSSATSVVETNIQSSGNGTTHIQTSANGQTKTLNATGNGTYRVSVSSNANNSNASSSVYLNSSKIASATPNVRNEKTETQQKNFIANFIKNFRNFLQNFFKRILRDF